jgi:hypothetical protein
VQINNQLNGLNAIISDLEINTTVILEIIQIDVSNQTYDNEVVLSYDLQHMQSNRINEIKQLNRLAVEVMKNKKRRIFDFTKLIK